MGQLVGYARVSSLGQSLVVQVDKLKEYGCEEIFQKKTLRDDSISACITGMFAARSKRGHTDYYEVGSPGTINTGPASDIG